jgi:hypothetical protein
MRSTLSPGLAAALTVLGACAGPSRGSAADGVEIGNVTLERFDAGPIRVGDLGSLDGIAIGRGLPNEEGVAQPDAVLGYRRTLRIEGLGEGRIVYLRSDPDGNEVEVDGEAYEERVRASADRMDEALPAACLAWIARCPELRDAVLDRIEAGASYRGASDGRASGAVGPYFWAAAVTVERAVKCSEPREDVDPLDTLFAFLLAADRAAERGRRSEDGAASNWSEPSAWRGGDPSVDRAGAYAFLEAERIARVVATLERSSACLRLDALPASFGAAYEGWAQRLAAAGGDPARLAEQIVAEELEAEVR